MAVYQCNETYVHRLKIRDRTGAVIYPTTVMFHLADSCGNLLTDCVMMSNGTETYMTDYNILTDCLFGEYKIVVRITDSAGDKAVFPDNFFVFPWKCLEEIRSKSGIEQNKTISDNDLARVAWDAYAEINDEIYELQKYENYTCDPDVNGLFNGTNKQVRIKIRSKESGTEIADHDGDGHVYGWGEHSCQTDVDGYWIDSDYARHKTNITNIDVITGRCQVTQVDNTAIPSSNRGVKVTYWVKWGSWNERLLRKATVLLASHEVVQKFNELDRATLADLQSNTPVLLANPNRLEILYMKTRDKIRKPMCGGTI